MWKYYLVCVLSGVLAAYFADSFKTLVVIFILALSLGCLVIYFLFEDLVIYHRGKDDDE